MKMSPLSVVTGRELFVQWVRLHVQGCTSCYPSCTVILLTGYMNLQNTLILYNKMQS